MCERLARDCLCGTSSLETICNYLGAVKKQLLERNYYLLGKTLQAARINAKDWSIFGRWSPAQNTRDYTQSVRSLSSVPIDVMERFCYKRQ